MPEGIQFEDDQDAKFLYSRIEKSKQAPKVVRFMVDRGWVKNASQATWVLVGVVVAIVIIAIVVFAKVGTGLDPSTTIELLPEESVGS